MSNGNNQKNTKMQEVQVKDFLMEFMPELFKNMGEDAHVRVSNEIDTMFVSVELDDPAVYIGKSGENCVEREEYDCEYNRKRGNQHKNAKQIITHCGIWLSHIGVPFLNTKRIIRQTSDHTFLIK